MKIITLKKFEASILALLLFSFTTLKSADSEPIFPSWATRLSIGGTIATFATAAGAGYYLSLYNQTKNELTNNKDLKVEIRNAKLQELKTYKKILLILAGCGAVSLVATGIGVCGIFYTVRKNSKNKPNPQKLLQEKKDTVAALQKTLNDLQQQKGVNEKQLRVLRAALHVFESGATLRNKLQQETAKRLKLVEDAEKLASENAGQEAAISDAEQNVLNNLSDNHLIKEFDKENFQKLLATRNTLLIDQAEFPVRIQQAQESIQQQIAAIEKQNNGLAARIKELAYAAPIEELENALNA